MDGSFDFDVVVVGGGPVGVTMGLLCAQRGLSTMVVERAIEVYDLPRAIVMDDEIQRVLQGAGLSDLLGRITSPLLGAEFVGVDGTRIIGIDIPPDLMSPLGHPFTVCYYQPELEALLRSAAVDNGVDLRLGVQVDEVRDLSDETAGSTGAVVTLRPLAGGADEVVSARWVVAADGASSPIRKGLGISLDNLGFDQDWLVVDTELLRDDVELPALVQQICDPERPTTFVPGHARFRRWEFQLQPGERRDDMVDPARVWALLAPWITPHDARLVRSVVYRFHATVASSMRSGAVLLVGDAAHQMPPFLGQGLCSGIRDAANLSWKLQLVAAGRAGSALLDTYDGERRVHATGVVAHAADVGRLIDQLSGRTDPTTSIDAAYGGGRPFPHLSAGMLAGTHPFVGRQLPQPTLDDEPLDTALGAGFALLTGDSASVPPETLTQWQSVGARLVVVPGHIMAAMFLANAAVVVVRPDRYVAAVADTAGALHAITGALFEYLA